MKQLGIFLAIWAILLSIVNAQEEVVALNFVRLAIKPAEGDKVSSTVYGYATIKKIAGETGYLLALLSPSEQAGSHDIWKSVRGTFVKDLPGNQELWVFNYTDAFTWYNFIEVAVELKYCISWRNYTDNNNYQYYMLRGGRKEYERYDGEHVLIKKDYMKINKVEILKGSGINMLNFYVLAKDTFPADKKNVYVSSDDWLNSTQVPFDKIYPIWQLDEVYQWEGSYSFDSSIKSLKLNAEMFTEGGTFTDNNDGKNYTLNVDTGFFENA